MSNSEWLRDVRWGWILGKDLASDILPVCLISKKSLNFENSGELWSSQSSKIFCWCWPVPVWVAQGGKSSQAQVWQGWWQSESHCDSDPTGPPLENQSQTTFLLVWKGWWWSESHCNSDLTDPPWKTQTPVSAWTYIHWALHYSTTLSPFGLCGQHIDLPVLCWHLVAFSYLGLLNITQHPIPVLIGCKMMKNCRLWLSWQSTVHQVLRQVHHVHMPPCWI